jgi:hypothetical protein
MRSLGGGLFVLLLLAAAPVRADPQRDPYARSFTLRIGGGAGFTASPDRFALTGSLAGLIPLGDLVVLEILGGTGVAPGSDVQTTQLWLRLALGARIETRTVPVRWYASIRVAHIHQAPLDSWGDHFGDSIAGDPSHGLGHLTALGGATGIAWDVPGTDRQLVLNAELEVLGLVHGAGPSSPAVWADLTIHAGWVFY